MSGCARKNAAILSAAEEEMFSREDILERLDCDVDDMQKHMTSAVGLVELLNRELQNLATQRVQDADSNFFENFTALPYKLENRRAQILREEKDCEMLSTPKNARRKRPSIQKGQLSKLESDQVTELYTEVLYTVRHRLGAKSPTHGKDASQPELMLAYAQSAFDVSPDDHLRLLTQVSEEQSPVTVLNVSVLEARDVVAKDANGYSDPYCMLGVVPASRLDPPESQSLNSMPTSGTPRRRSFRGSKNQSTMPAKKICTTTVRPATLHPKWFERFRFDVDDPDSDLFHLDIWDHDDEESVFEAAKKLNQVEGFKGLSRYFKQVAQSARAGDDVVDDFLGSLTLKISDIPSTGVEQWHDLQKRSQRGTVTGDIKLRLWLGSRVSHGTDDPMQEFAQHTSLMKVFTEYEIRKSGREPFRWSGDLDNCAESILHQHAIQGDLTELQQHICRWLALSQINQENMLDPGVMAKLLERMLPLVKKEEITVEEDHQLTQLLSSYVRNCLEHVKNHRDVFSAKKKSALKRLSEMLRSLRLIYDCPYYQNALSGATNLTGEIEAIIKHGAVSYYEKCKVKPRHASSVDSDSAASAENPTQLSTLSRLTNAASNLNSGCERALAYHKSFMEELNINYFFLNYREWERSLLQQEIATLCMQRKLSGDLVGCSVLDLAQGDEENNLLHIFELYLALSEFMRFRDEMELEDRKKVPVCELEFWFERALSTWLSMAKNKCVQRIEMATQLDKPLPKADDSEVKQSSSYVDVVYCFQQIAGFWEQLKIPDLIRRTEYSQRLIKDICSCATYYSDLQFGDLEQSGILDQHDLAKNQDAADRLCITVNNVEHVRRLINELPDFLHLPAIMKKLEYHLKDQNKVMKWRNEIYSPIETTDRQISAKSQEFLSKLVEQQRDSLKKHVFHLAWSPEGCPTEEAVKPLIAKLDTVLVDYHRWLLKQNFNNLLMAQFCAVVNEISDAITENAGGEPGFYCKLDEAIDILLEFFHAGGKGPSQDRLHGFQCFLDVRRLLQLNRLRTRDLISEYYRQLHSLQEAQTDCPYGTVTVKAFYNEKTCCVHLEVINARSIIPLDANGLSDPFFIIELVPSYVFPDTQVAKTRVAYKTLNPDYDESFLLKTVKSSETPRSKHSIGGKMRQQGYLHLIAMDHDFLVSNDFAGEALLPLSELGDGDRASMKQFTLTLMHETLASPSPLTVLTARKQDKEAAAFMAHLETIRRS